jgi:hypothetical protein
MIKDRIIFAAIANDDPHPASPRIFKHWGKEPGMVRTFLLSIHQDEACILSVQVKNRSIGDISGLEKLRGGKIVDGGENSHKRACPHDKEVEIRGQNTIDKAVLHKLSDTKVSPVNLGFIHVVGYQISSLPY